MHTKKIKVTIKQQLPSKGKRKMKDVPDVPKLSRTSVFPTVWLVKACLSPKMYYMILIKTPLPVS
jgi:hypothetical protein